MANLNKVMLIGRLTRDPETRTFPNGGKVAKFGFAVNNRKKNPNSGQWEDEAVFLDVKAFNRDQGRKMADQVEQYFQKGRQFYIEGHLQLEEWEDKNGGGKRSKLVIIMNDYQFLEGRQDGQGEGRAPMRSAAPARQPQAQGGYSSGFSEEPDMEPVPPAGGATEDIPF
jgi:single-strand DNA-binding protein